MGQFVLNPPVFSKKFIFLTTNKNGSAKGDGIGVFTIYPGQEFGDPARLVLGQTGDSATIQNIRKELYLDQPKW